MSISVFKSPPTVELLQWLARGSLRQPDVLTMAVRLWVILRTLYGESSDPVYLSSLRNVFSYADWRTIFFKDMDTYHRDLKDKISPIHTPGCPCAKTICDWLFDPEVDLCSVSLDKWKQSFQQHYSVSDAEVERVLDPVAWVYNPDDSAHRAFGQSESSWKKSMQELYKLSEEESQTLLRQFKDPKRELHKSRPFAFSRKTLSKDLKTLVELGWLEQFGKSKYKKVSNFPSFVVSNQEVKLSLPEISSGRFIHSELAGVADNFARPLNGVQRFFIHVEYIISSRLYGQIQLLQERLQEIWSQEIVPPVKIKYRSAKAFQEEVERIVYPVCICYFQRAPYLFAFGQVPKDKNKLDWYDYRLDRIQELTQLAWEDLSVPSQLRSDCLDKTPPNPQQVSQLMSEALGFDFYQRKEIMLLRFDPYFDANYIEGTERDSLFQKISYTEANKLVRKNSSEDQKASLSILENRSSKDIYRWVKYHVKDYSVIMRIRAWGPKVEVISPWSMRREMRSDLEKTWKMYQ